MGDSVPKSSHQTEFRNGPKYGASEPAGKVHWNCQLPDTKEWLMFSKEMEYLAICIVGLSRGTRSRYMKAAHFFVEQLVELTNFLGPLLMQYGWTCAAINPDEDSEKIENRRYHSAHHAAFGEAARFLKGLQDRMCADLPNDGDFDPAIIIEDWERVRIYILAQFSKQWMADSLTLRRRIRRERREFALKSKSLAMDAKPKSADLPKVNLKMNQIRYRGKCYDVEADGALLVDRLVLAYPEWFSASENGFSKPSKIKDALPAPIRNLIETKPGKGYRLKII